MPIRESTMYRSTLALAALALVFVVACGDGSDLNAANADELAAEGDAATARQLPAERVTTGNDAGTEVTVTADAGVLEADGGAVVVAAESDAGKAESNDDAAPSVPSVGLAQVVRQVFKPASCTTCHPAAAEGVTEIDLRATTEIVATLIKNARIVCNGKPYITPGDASRSFLVDVISSDTPGCSVPRMPNTLEPLTDTQIALVRTWIEQGARY